MHTFSVIYSILKLSDGDIVSECEVAQGRAESKVMAEFRVIQQIRNIFPNDEYRVVVHEVIDHDEE